MNDDIITMRREQYRDGKFIGADEWSFSELEIFSLPQDEDFYCLKKSDRHNDHFVVTRTKGLNIKTLEWQLEWESDRVYIVLTSNGIMERYVCPVFADGSFGRDDYRTDFQFAGYQIAEFSGLPLPRGRSYYERGEPKTFPLGTLVGYGLMTTTYLVKADDQWVHVFEGEVDRQNLTLLPTPDYEPIPFDEVS